MLQSFNNLNQLTEKQLKVFISELGDGNHFEKFFKLLKSASDDEKQLFFKAIEKSDYCDWFKMKANATEMPTQEELKEIDSKISEITAIIPKKRIELEENTLKAKALVLEYRKIMKAGFEEIGKSLTDQNEGIEIPPVQKTVESGAEVIKLPEANPSVILEADIFSCLNYRKSRRKYKDEPLKLEELSFLLWATQGLKGKFYNDKMTIRTVPSGGSRHPFETYLAVNSVEGLKNGIYRYQPLEHQLVYLFEVEDQKNKVSAAAYGQKFVGECAVTFIWSCIPYRCEWRYTVESKKIILQDSGHLCQNLYIACEAIRCGTCAIGAYDQKLFDDLLKLDGTDEFTIYVAPVGKVKQAKPAVKLTLNELEKFCGYYWCESEKLSRKIYLKQNNLYYLRSETNESMLIPVADCEFKMADTDAYLTFSVNQGKYKIILRNEDEKDFEFIDYNPAKAEGN